MKIVILGGGISGLSAAWYLQKKYPEARIVLLEKSERLGGWIQTEKKGDWLFEKGPRTFPVSRGENLLQLISEVGLEGELIFSEKAKRYLLYRGKLRSPLSLAAGLFPGFARELFVPKGDFEDESIYDFACRRFSREIAETFFDALTLGIYGGDSRKLSVQSCFSFLKKWEQEKGSVLKGLLRRKKKQENLFNLRSGIGSLIEALAKKLPVQIEVDCPVESIEKEGVSAGGKFWRADRVVSALPGQVLGRLTGAWKEFPTSTFWVVHLRFSKPVLKKEGFGYLIPTREGERVMGVVWDSCIFPQHGEGRMTVMLREGEGDPVEASLDALRRHLSIQEKPAFTEAFLAREVIPQFEVGYAKRLETFRHEMAERLPRLSFLGNYLEGGSVDTCIRVAKNIT